MKTKDPYRVHRTTSFHSRFSFDCIHKIYIYIYIYLYISNVCFTMLFSLEIEIHLQLRFTMNYKVPQQQLEIFINSIVCFNKQFVI